MSEDVKCDGCGKTGRRRRFYPSPTDWSFMEVTDEERPKDTLFVYACSKECKQKLWKTGPGERFSPEEILNA